MDMMDLNEVSKEIGRINEEHGFREAIPRKVGNIASQHLDSIILCIDDFEDIRRDHNSLLAQYRGRDCTQASEMDVKLLLVISEVIESVRSSRDGDTASFKEELIDILIRVLDIADMVGCDVESVLTSKMSKNRDRPYKHGYNF